VLTRARVRASARGERLPVTETGGDGLHPTHALLLGLQREAGNAAVASLVRSSRGPGSSVADGPDPVYVGPFDRRPESAPGERVIMEGKFKDESPGDYQLEWSTTGGHFLAPDGPTTLTQPGLSSGNVNFFVPTLWNGLGTMQVVLRVRKRSDGSVARTETWNFGIKLRYPETMTQQEGGGERDIPARYHYTVGPVVVPYAAPYYEHQSILERFENWRLANVGPDDIAEPYRNEHGLATAEAVSEHFLGDYDGSNGTFTVDGKDEIRDKHTSYPDLRRLVRNLAAPKDVEVALPQTYEARPGTPLGRYVITRIRKADGTWRVRKEPV